MSNGKYELTLSTVESGSVADVKIWVRFFETATPTRDILSARNQKFDSTLTFTIEDHNSAYPLICEVNAPGFLINISDPFRFKANKAESVLQLFRSPGDWEPQFDKWNDLGNPFNKFKSVLSASQGIRIKDGQRFDYLTGSTYDNLSSDSGILGKMCLLNLYVKLSRTIEPTVREYSWFKYVNRILSFNRERFIAIVDDEMHDIISTIKENIDDYDEYENASSSLHYENLGSLGHRFNESNVKSIKSSVEKGNIQLCTTPATDADGKAVTLLDADIDENGDLLKHLADVLKHKFTGGTHPLDIHEFLALEEPKDDFGYSLEQT